MGIEPARRRAAGEVVMTSDLTSSTRTPLREAMRTGARELSGYWGWFLVLGILWTGFGMYVLSYRVGSLAAVAALVGVAFLFGGITQLAVASRVQSWRWLFILAGIIGVAAGIVPSSGRTSPCMWCRSWSPGT
jgi:uncharacterized membrane protein HdeD (DUF308 family)